MRMPFQRPCRCQDNGNAPTSTRFRHAHKTLFSGNYGAGARLAGISLNQPSPPHLLPRTGGLQGSHDNTSNAWGVSGGGEPASKGFVRCSECLLELGRAAAKKGLAITPIFGGLAAGGPSEKLFARSIMYHRTSTLQLIHSTLHDPFQQRCLPEEPGSVVEVVRPGIATLASGAEDTLLILSGCIGWVMAVAPLVVGPLSVVWFVAKYSACPSSVAAPDGDLRKAAIS
jgi:hypothetical protein